MVFKETPFYGDEKQMEQGSEMEAYVLTEGSWRNWLSESWPPPGKHEGCEAAAREGCDTELSHSSGDVGSLTTAVLGVHTNTSQTPLSARTSCSLLSAVWHAGCKYSMT